MKPLVIVICGSTRFIELMAVCAWLLERDEGAITIGLHLLPAWYPNVPPDHLAEAEGVKEKLDDLHLRKIDLADFVFVVNRDDYIGESTHREVRYAIDRNVPIRWYTDDPIGKAVEKMLRETP